MMNPFTAPTPRRARQKRLAQRLLALLLFLIILGFAGALSWRYRASFDWTYAGRNSLSAASRQQLARMPGPIAVTVFMSPNPDTRKVITRWFERYQRVAGKRLTVRFVDPAANPNEVRKYEVSQPEGQLFIEYQKRRESLSALDENTITSALQRLSYSAARQVVFLAGQGEPAAGDDGEKGFSSFADTLRDKGLKVSSVNPAAGEKIPADTALLVVGPGAGARLAGVDKLVDDYAANGGNLLWLADTSEPPGLDALSARLGIGWRNGYAIFPQFLQLGTGHPGNYVEAQFPPNEVTRGFAEYAIFPLARPFTVAPKPEWNPETLLQTSPDSWVETSTTDDIGQDASEPSGVAIFGETFSRRLDGRAGGTAGGPATGRQRVAVIGDAGFLENGSLDALGNRALGERLALWLTGRDADVGITPPKAPDAVLLLSLPRLIAYAAGFAIVLPLLLLAFGLVRRRRRQRR